MKAYLKILFLAIGCLLALYFNAFYLIILVAFIYGIMADSKRLLKPSLVAFLVAFLVWTVCLYVKDASFFRAPSTVLSGVLGDLPSWLIPLFGGLVGGILALIGTMAGQLLSSKSED